MDHSRKKTRVEHPSGGKGSQMSSTLKVEHPKKEDETIDSEMEERKEEQVE
jgi:hypothetical protein